MPQTLTAGETTILKSKIQAGATGHAQKVVLNAYTGGATTLRSAYYISATIMPNGKPGLLMNGLDSPYTAGTQKVYFVRYLSETLISSPVMLFPYATAHLSIATYKGIIVAIAYDLTNTRIRMRTSADNGATWTAEVTVPAATTFAANTIGWGGSNVKSGMILRANKAQTSLNLFFLGISATPAAPTVALGAAGVLTGAYTYKVTFVTNGFETSGGTTSAVVNPAAQQVAVSAIALGPTGTTARKLYRTLAGGADGTQKLVTTIADNTTTTYTDNIADASLGAAYPVAVSANVFYRSTTNADPSLGWSAAADSGFRIPSVARNYGGTVAYNQGDTRAYAIVETKTPGTWVIAAESDDGDWHANHAFFSGTLGGAWTRRLNDGYGGGISGGQGANGNVFLDRSGDVIGYAMSDAGESVTWWRSTDSGTTWGAGTDVGIQGAGIAMGAGDGLYVSTFATKEFIWGGRAGAYNTTPYYCDLLVTRLSSLPVANLFDVLGQGAAGGNIAVATATDVSDRVIAISFDKATQLDSDTFNVELQNEDGALNINTDVTPGSLAAYAKPNVIIDIYQWHGPVANSTQTFHGIIDSVRQHDSPRTVVLTGRCGIKKLLVQEVRLIGGQDLKVAGYIRDTSNFVYLNKTLNEVLNHILDYAGIAGSSRALAPSTFVFKELRGNDQETLMDLARRACDVAGMEFWCDELGLFRSRTIGAKVATSSWTFRSYEDITVLDPDTDDDGLKTRVRVLGKANIGAKYLAEQFHWAGPETPGATNGPAGIAYDKLTATVWLLTQNSNLYRLDPNANMAIVAGPFALGLGYPDGIAVDPLDNHLWISDGYNASLGNNASRVYKKINRSTQALMLGPFTNPDGDHCAPWAWDSSGTGAGPVRIKMTTYTSGQIVTMSIAGAEVSRVASPVSLPTALTSDTGGGLYLTGWDAADFYQASFAGSITNTIAAPSKNGNGISAVEDPIVFDFGAVYEVWRDQNLIVKYAPTVPTGVDTATYAEVVNLALEQALIGEVRLARLTDLAITDKAQATVTARRQLDRLSIYAKHLTVGVLGHPGIQKGDRVTINVPGASINGDWSVISIRSDQNARSGSWLMVLVIVPYRPLAG